MGKAIVATSKACDAFPKDKIDGCLFIRDNPEDFSNKVFEILSSNISFGENGLKAVQNIYNWDVDSQVLIKLYQDYDSK